MISIVIQVALIIVLIIGFLLATMYWSINGYIFYPLKEHIWQPKIPYKKVFLEGRLSGWYFDNHPGSRVMLFCHGNYGNISHNDFVVEICHNQKLNLLIFDYSGYGYSLGRPDSKTVCLDGECAYRYLRNFYEPDDIILWGQSLGGAVATYVASRHPCSNLILLSTFSSLDDVLFDSDSFPSILIRGLGLITDTMSSKTRIRDVKCPVAILHSKLDEVIPYSNAERLYKSIPHPCKMFIEIGGGHGNPEMTEEHLRSIFDFCCLDVSECYLSKNCLEVIKNLDQRYANCKDFENTKVWAHTCKAKDEPKDEPKDELKCDVDKLSKIDSLGLDIRDLQPLSH